MLFISCLIKLVFFSMVEWMDLEVVYFYGVIIIIIISYKWLYD